MSAVPIVPNRVYPWREAPQAEFAVIGDPVAHSLSPKMHNAAFGALGLDYLYVAIQIPSGEVGPALDWLQHLGYTGLNVTVPHKEEVLVWAHEVGHYAALVRAANTVNLPRRACINTDAPGFLDTLIDLGVTGGRVLLLGAGGSARALALALHEQGFDLGIFNRTRSRAQAMIESLGICAELLDEPDPSGADLILNTTAASLADEEIPVQWSRAQQGALAYDLMYAKQPTRFLQRAADHGLAIVDGLPLLVAQGARSFEWWLDQPAPRQAMMDAVR